LYCRIISLTAGLAICAGQGAGHVIADEIDVLKAAVGSSGIDIGIFSQSLTKICHHGKTCSKHHHERQQI